MGTLHKFKPRETTSVTKKLTPQQEQLSLDERCTRIKTSIERINKLMAELRSMNTREEKEGEEDGTYTLHIV